MGNKTYLVELTPVGNYFFGSERTFNSTDKATNESRITNYLVRSRMYPQQTSLLGLIRYVLLLKNGKLNGTIEEKAKLIGQKSFQGMEAASNVKWGIINTISPLFLKNGDKKYTIAGQDYQYYKDEEDVESITLLKSENDADTLFSINKDSHLIFSNYNFHGLSLRRINSRNNWNRANSHRTISNVEKKKKRKKAK